DTGRRQAADRDHGNERDDQRVLDERLAFLGLHLRQLDPRRESLNHFLAPFLPSGVDVMFVLLLSIDRPRILSVVFVSSSASSPRRRRFGACAAAAPAPFRLNQTCPGEAADFAQQAFYRASEIDFMILLTFTPVVVKTPSATTSMSE